MTVDPSDTEPLALQLFRDDDDDEDVFYKKKLEALVNGSVTPLQAASDFHAWIMDENNKRLEEFMKRPYPRGLTPEEEEQDISLGSIMPNTSGYIGMVFPSIARLCSAFPPFHAGQDRIIQFLEALRSMPRHQAPDHNPSGGPGDEVDMVTLWPFGDNWMALAEVFRREAEEMSYPYSDIETPGSEVQIRWRNFQSAIARITVLGLIDCGFLCALGAILPSDQFYPDFETRKIGGPNRVGGDVIAGGQWILWLDGGTYVHQQCKKVEKVDVLREMWSIERWNVWKRQFAFVAADRRFDSKARLVAELAGHKMLALEKEHAEGTAI